MDDSESRTLDKAIQPRRTVLTTVTNVVQRQQTKGLPTSPSQHWFLYCVWHTYGQGLNKIGEETHREGQLDRRSFLAVYIDGDASVFTATAWW